MLSSASNESRAKRLTKRMATIQIILADQRYIESGFFMTIYLIGWIIMLSYYTKYQKSNFAAIQKLKFAEVIVKVNWNQLS